MNSHYPVQPKIRFIFLSAVVYILLSGFSVQIKADENEVIIIGNPDIFESTLTKKEIRDIFLEKKRKWTDGKEIVLTVMYHSTIHETFMIRYINKTPAQFLNFCKHLVFVGQGRFPKAFSSEEEMMDYIEKTSGAIGYLSQKPPEGKKLKIITLTE
ncbi:MAG: hypothetical protein KJ737_26445 [Proteobacteria bacterium]|nr:hypothetical protein [Pseudomonadota bacterium]